MLSDTKRHALKPKEKPYRLYERGASTARFLRRAAGYGGSNTGSMDVKKLPALHQSPDVSLSLPGQRRNGCGNSLRGVLTRPHRKSTQDE